MLSLPLIPPQNDQSTWMRNYQRPRSPSPPASAGQNPQQTHRQRQQRDEEKKQFNARSALAQLAADEAAIAHRKAAVRNFGAYWIRPPGVPKTLQAMTEEEAERLEQAELERQERGLLDMQAQQQLEEARLQAEEAAAATAPAEGGEEGERDLDDDIPEAEADMDEDEGNTTTEVTFNEDSMMEGSHAGRRHREYDDHDDDVEDDDDDDNANEADDERHEDGLEANDDDDNDDADEDEHHYAEMEEAELTGAARDEEELGLALERDLDDSIPEAGSYQHTDTELEDSTSESELNTSFATGRAASSSRPRRTPQSRPHGTPQLRPGLDLHPMPGLQERMRAQVGAADALARSPGSLNLSSSLLESSFMESSPVIQRSNQPGRGRGEQTRRARGS